MAGETTTWNAIADRLDTLYGASFSRSYIPMTTMEAIVKEEQDRTAADSEHDSSRLATYQMHIWQAVGAMALPSAEVATNRLRFFEGVRFRSIEEAVREASQLQDGEVL